MQGVSYNTFLLKKWQLLGMTTQSLPDYFDVIVVGTGLEESIVAAAAARNGHSVLHVDENDYYGGDWAAFNLQGLKEWAEKENGEIVDEGKNFSYFLQEGETALKMGVKSGFKDVRVEWFAESDPDFEENESKKRWTREKIEENGRKFNLDLSPRLLFSRGSMVELLISSNISRYAEFKSASRVLTVLKDGRLEHVPSSRSDVFATKHVSVVEKRILMKFITFCVDFQSHPDIWEGFKFRPFLDFLKHQKLTENLINFVISSIAMVSLDASCLEGLKATQKFLNSIGRFGNTPFLWSMYGSGELPQAFCRLCAVFGGTYFLGKPIEAVISKQGEVTGVIFNGQRISCQKLVLDVKKCPSDLKEEVTMETVNRKICLLSDSIMPSEKEQLTFVSVPPEDPDGSFTYVQEVGFGTAVCPKGMYVMHVTSRSEDGSVDTGFSVDKVLEDKSRLLFCADFRNEVQIPIRIRKNNVYFCTGPTFELDFDSAIRNAKNIFRTMYEGEDFLPRAPDPEEIVVGGDEGDSKGAEEALKNVPENSEEIEEEFKSMSASSTKLEHSEKLNENSIGFGDERAPVSENSKKVKAETESS